MTENQIATAPVALRERDQTVDVLRGIGMVVVAMGHIDFSPIGGSLDVYLYMFNVPLFFVITGYMWQPKPGASTWRQIVRRARAIYLPYVVLFLIAILYGNLVVRYLFGQPVAPFDAIETVKAFVFASDWLNKVPTFNFALWFLPIFFLTSIAFVFLQKIHNLAVYSAVLIALFAISYPFQLLIPGRPILAINVLPVGLVFMGAGYLIRRFLPIARLPLIVFPLLCGVTLAIALWAPGNIAGMNGYLYVPAALAAFAFYFRVAHQLRSSTWLAFVGRNSLLVFGLHGLIANTYQYTHIPQYLSRHWDGALLYLIDLGYVLGVSVAIVMIYLFLKGTVSGWWRRRRSRAEAGGPSARLLRSSKTEP